MHVQWLDMGVLTEYCTSVTVWFPTLSCLMLQLDSVNDIWTQLPWLQLQLQLYNQTYSPRKRYSQRSEYNSCCHSIITAPAIPSIRAVAVATKGVSSPNQQQGSQLQLSSQPAAVQPLSEVCLCPIRGNAKRIVKKHKNITSQPLQNAKL